MSSLSSYCYYRLPSDVVENVLFPYLSPVEWITTQFVFRDSKPIAKRLLRNVSHDNRLFSLFRNAALVECLRWFHTKLGFPIYERAPAGLRFLYCVYLAAKHRHFQILNHLNSMKCDWQSEPTTAAIARSGDLSMLQWAVANRSTLNKRILQSATKSRNVAMINYITLNFHTLKRAKIIALIAAKKGYFEIVKGILLNSKAPARTMAAAAKSGRLDMLKWLNQTQPTLIIDGPTLVNAARSGNTEMVIYLKNKGALRWHWTVCAAAAKGGHLDLLKWLRANGCPWECDETMIPLQKHSCLQAARHGHLEVLKWARGDGAPWNFTVCLAAAERGDTKMLEWIHANSDFPFDAEECRRAARNGHLETLQWLRARGCPWHELLCCESAFAGHIAVLQWARTNGCPWDKTKCNNHSPDRLECSELGKWNFKYGVIDAIFNEAEDTIIIGHTAITHPMY